MQEINGEAKDKIQTKMSVQRASTNFNNLSVCQTELNKKIRNYATRKSFKNSHFFAYDSMDLREMVCAKNLVSVLINEFDDRLSFTIK